MKGPTIRHSAEGSARRTANEPRSRERGTIRVRMASQEKRSPGIGSSALCQLIAVAPVLFDRKGGGPFGPRTGGCGAPGTGPGAPLDSGPDEGQQVPIDDLGMGR